MSYKEVYERLKKSEDLFEIYEGMTGDWILDKIEFINQHKALNSQQDGYIWG
ncbi:hypothetical protein [Flavobacterium sp.]|jgi:hypothetical protein|uniref:hypothetical protein n=1 Tax=Flavobacterium sp. TaxID=239 RepID=UPI0037BEDA02